MSIELNGTWVCQNFNLQSDNAGSFFHALDQIIKIQKEREFHRNFKQWQSDFEQIYPQETLTHELFKIHSLLNYSIIAVVLIRVYVLDYHQGKNDSNLFLSKNLHNLCRSLEIPDYFSHYLTHPDMLYLFSQLLNQKLSANALQDDLFANLYQNLIGTRTRHSKGEFYTYPALAKKMIESVYQFGMQMLDPSCGSGIFLIEAAKKILAESVSQDEKISAISNLYGFDINILACIMCRANLLSLAPSFIASGAKFKVFQMNFLFPKSNFLENEQCKFDLVIGNPPWVVLNRIPSKTEKENIKALGNQFGILRGGKLATSTEITTIFCYQSVHKFLKDDGMLFFITPASLATGAQHELFRQFIGLKQIEFWAFEQDAFLIHNLCFKARKGQETFENRMKISWKTHSIDQNLGEIALLSEKKYKPSRVIAQNTNQKKKKITEYNPQNQTYPKYSPNPSLLIGKLIDAQENSEDISSISIESQCNNLSEYRALFRQGASLVPRNLLFIDMIEKDLGADIFFGNKNSELSQICPANSIQSKKYSTWEFEAYEKAVVEKKYLFKVAKSTGLIPYAYLQPYYCFLPLEKEEQKYIIKRPVLPYAASHFDKISQIYERNIKQGAEIKKIETRIDYGHALTDKKQLNPFKVVYGGIGSIVKAALLRDIMFVDTSLYYYIPKSEDEAYFLLGYLNSPWITLKVKSVGSTGANGSLRNIHKHPLEFGLPVFNSNNESHQQISILAQNIEKYVLHTIINLYWEKFGKDTSLKKLQQFLFKDKKIQSYLEQMDSYVINLGLSSVDK